ncbi:MAG: GAF domain-containing sensor histidine kinase [bacterium]
MTQKEEHHKNTQIALANWINAVYENDITEANECIKGSLLESCREELEALFEHINDCRFSPKKLKINYEISPGKGEVFDLDDLLIRSIHLLRSVLNVQSAMLWLKSDDGEVYLETSAGLRKELLVHQELNQLHQCMTQCVLDEGIVHYQDDLVACENVFGSQLFPGQAMSMVNIPLETQNKSVGVLSLFVEQKSLPEHTVVLDRMLFGIARHLARSVASIHEQEKIIELAIQEERNRISHELHDSLAQSMASLRFQVRVLDDVLHGGDEESIWHEVEKVEESLESANIELREMIAKFRGPRTNRNLPDALMELVERFTRETKIKVFTQKEWGSVDLPGELAIQAYRIVQEALSNVRKHSKAATVRLLLRHDDLGHFRILIEDDGVGIRFRDIDDFSNHFGVKVMYERAQKLKGELKFEGEPGEGTRVQLDFDWTPVRSVQIETSGEKL